MMGERNPAWVGGVYIEPGKGYRMIRMPTHARARANGYVLEHILVAEKMLGRPLRPGEEVHHKNGIRNDNRPENLEVFPDHKSHWVPNHMRAMINARLAAASARGKAGARR
jgi:hypothetical protein